MWTKKNDHASKKECADLFSNICSKRAILKKKKKSSSTILLSSHGFSCLLFLLDVSKMWLANLLTTFFTKRMSNLICTCDMYLVLYIEHYLQPASCHMVEYVLIKFWRYFLA